MSAGFWRERPTFVTRGTGLVASWPVRRLVEAEAKVVCLLNEPTNEIRHQYLGAAKACSALGWAPLCTLDEGLKQTIERYRKVLEPTR